MQTFQAFRIEFTHHTTTNKRVTTKIETKPLLPNTILKGNYEIQTFLVLIKDCDLENLVPSFIIKQTATLIVYASFKKVTTLKFDDEQVQTLQQVHNFIFKKLAPKRLYFPNESFCIIIPCLQSLQKLKLDQPVIEDSAKFIKLDVLEEYFTSHELESTESLLSLIPYEKISPYLNKYSTIDSSIEYLISKDEEFAKAVTKADEISKSLKGKIVVTKVNNFPYSVAYVDFTLTPQSIMDISTQTSYLQYYGEKYDKHIEDKNQPLIRCDFINSFRMKDKRVDKLKSPTIFSLRRREIGQQKKAEKPKYSKHSGSFRPNLIPELCLLAPYDKSFIDWVSSLNKLYFHVEATLNHYKLLEEFEKHIGVTFKNKALLRQALTHKSYAIQVQQGKSANQRLEFLGDAVLGLLTATKFYEIMEKEKIQGDWFELFMKLIGNKHLQTIAANLGIVKYFLYVGQTEENILSNTKTLADAFEALIAAIHIGNGLQETITFWEKFVLPDSIEFLKQLRTEMSQEKTTDKEEDKESEIIHKPKLEEIAKEPQTINDVDEDTCKLLKKFQKEIGISFNDELVLLQALTHFSKYSKPIPVPTEQLPAYYSKYKRNDTLFGHYYGFNYEKLRFLGTYVLGFIIEEHLFKNYLNATEEHMTLVKHKIVERSNKTCQNAYKMLNLSSYVQYDTKSYQISDKILGDVLTALVGAIYLDRDKRLFKAENCNHYDVYGSFVHKYLLNFSDTLEELDPSHVHHPVKHDVQRAIQQLFKVTPKFSVVHEGDTYKCQIIVCLGEGEAKSREEAERIAIEKTIKFCKEREERNI